MPYRIPAWQLHRPTREKPKRLISRASHRANKDANINNGLAYLVNNPPPK